MGEIFPVCEKLRYTIAHGERDLAPERRGVGRADAQGGARRVPPARRGRRHLPVELPLPQRPLPGDPGAVRRQRGGRQGVGVDLVVGRRFPGHLRRGAAASRPLDRPGPDHHRGGRDRGRRWSRRGVDKIFFTGSPENGKKVMATAAETLTPVVLELGGKDPMIVCDDADLEQAVAAAMLGRLHRLRPDVRGRRAPLRLRRDLRSLRRRGASRRCERCARGAHRDGGGEFDVGAMTMPRQLEIIERQVDDAVARRAPGSSPAGSATRASPVSSSSRPCSPTSTTSMARDARGDLRPGDDHRPRARRGGGDPPRQRLRLRARLERLLRGRERAPSASRSASPPG